MTTTQETEVIPLATSGDTQEFEAITSSLRSFPLEGYAPATAGKYRHARSQPRTVLPSTLLGRPIGTVVRHLIGAAILGTVGGLALGLTSLPAGPSVAGTPDAVPTMAPQLTPRPASTGEPEDGAESPYVGSDRTGSASSVTMTSVSTTARPLGPSGDVAPTATAGTPQPEPSATTQDPPNDDDDDGNQNEDAGENQNEDAGEGENEDAGEGENEDAGEGENEDAGEGENQNTTIDQDPPNDGKR